MAGWANRQGYLLSWLFFPVLWRYKDELIAGREPAFHRWPRYIFRHLRIETRLQYHRHTFPVPTALPTFEFR
jgi:hypothetical protein